MENNKKLADIECGFRRHRPTIYHLMRFDTYIRKAFADGSRIVAVFFDLENVYDMARYNEGPGRSRIERKIASVYPGVPTRLILSSKDR